MGSHTAFYDLLEVPVDASLADIRKAYRQQARKVHPDKNLNDPSAAARFQALGRAYQILSDPNHRSKYDEGGKDAVSTEKLLEPVALFASLFGGDLFNVYVGQLRLATVAAYACNPGTTGLPSITNDAAEESDDATGVNMRQLGQRLSAIQHERIDKLVEALTRRLDVHIQGDLEGFRHWALLESDNLLLTRYGKEMLATVGYMYQHSASRQLGKGWLGLGMGCAAEWVSMKSHFVRSGLGALHGTVQLMQIQKEMKDEQNAEHLVLASRQDEILKHLWKLNAVDIEQTLDTVCREVLTETGVPWEVLNKRAKALRDLGLIFQARARAAGQQYNQQQQTSNSSRPAEPPASNQSQEGLPHPHAASGTTCEDSPEPKSHTLALQMKDTIQETLNAMGRFFTRILMSDNSWLTHRYCNITL